MGLALEKTGGTRQAFLSALRGEKTKHAPFWLMRQAGRYLPEYRALREKAGGFLNLCFTPEMAAEATLQPVRRFDTDAAILFSDILTVPLALGQPLRFAEGEGPVLDAVDFSALAFHPKKLEPVYEAARRVRGELPGDKTLIGFAGAPWTLACYMIQGRGDGEFRKALDFARMRKGEFSDLIDMLCAGVTECLLGQIRAGAGAVQIFDSWAGLLPHDMFMEWAVIPVQKIVANLRDAAPDVPVIGFPRGVADDVYSFYARETGVAGISLGTGTDIEKVSKDCGPRVCIQGNLDPETLLAGGARMEEEALRILEATRGRPFIFNLGHGVIKETPPENVARLAKTVRGFAR